MKLRELIEVYDPVSITEGNISIRIYPEVGSGEYLDVTLKKDGNGKATLNSFIGPIILEKEVVKMQVIDFNMLAVHLGAEVVEEVEPEESTEVISPIEPESEPELSDNEEVQNDEELEDEEPEAREEKEQED